ncbi:YlmC/YmxH family sporulation protein [Alteribacillus bidgolensis]|uniref:Sporulation protein, YlmC/YmxH family n=1 Tax=Alteribacillus bidgolensis TaxID=930129 RepID=A0A1G8GHY3_9BACI|nr:YlmC/YmxH family sporulation protein [Alteribacillus bidgolensis]SDH93993.1 sporulation protein, YlmC/YmxH family [Alteribacillus bidgolensis]
MRLSEISKKEVLDANTGEKLGMPGSADLVIKKETGRIESLVLPSSPAYPFRKRTKEWVIPWENIQRIGEDFVIIDTAHLKKIPERSE